MLIRMHLSSLRGLRITSFDLVTVGLAAQRVGQVVFQRAVPSERRELYVHASAADMAGAATFIQQALDPERRTVGWMGPDLAAPALPA